MAGVTASVPAVLRTLARLGLRTRRRVASVDLRAPDARAVWLGFGESWSWMASPTMPTTRPLWLPRSPELDQLAAIDGLRRDERLVRAGWTVLRGLARFHGHELDLCTPLVSWPIRLEVHGPDQVVLTAAGDQEATPLIGDRRRAEWLAEGFAFDGGRLRQPMDSATMRRPEYANWTFEVTRRAGLGEPKLLGPSVDPIRRIARHPEAVVGLVVYLARRTAAEAGTTRRPLDWAERQGVEQTALAALYGVESAEPRAELQPEPQHGGGELVSPLPLSAAQRDVIAASRHSPITVVSGPPGCGKTHTVTALALDAVARGESVLLATRGRHAAEVIGGMLRRAAGPLPVMFGDTEARADIAAELAATPVMPQVMRAVDTARLELTDAVAALDRAESVVDGALAAEDAARRARAGAELLGVHREAAPRLFDDPMAAIAARRAVTAAGRALAPAGRAVTAAGRALAPAGRAVLRCCRCRCSPSPAFANGGDAAIATEVTENHRELWIR